MLDRVKVIITREDGSPICGLAGAELVEYLSDEAPVLVLRKTGGTVEAFSGELPGVLDMLSEWAEGQRRKN